MNDIILQVLGSLGLAGAIAVVVLLLLARGIFGEAGKDLYQTLKKRLTREPVPAPAAAAALPAEPAAAPPATTIGTDIDNVETPRIKAREVSAAGPGATGLRVANSKVSKGIEIDRAKAESDPSGNA